MQRILFVEEYCQYDEYHFQLQVVIQNLQYAKQISVSHTIPRHKSRFWPAQFSLSITSSKFPNEVSHTRFDLLYFVKEMFNGKKIRHESCPVLIQ